MTRLREIDRGSNHVALAQQRSKIAFGEKEFGV